MTHLGRGQAVGWRGSVRGREAEKDASREPGEGDRVLVLMSSHGNRSQVTALLGRHFDVRVWQPSDTAPVGEYDLAVVDASALANWHQFLVDAKIRYEPTFLPLLLILPKRDLKRRLRKYWDVVDEFVSSPIDRRELVERVSMLLHIRHLAIAQQTYLAHVVNHDRSTGLPNKILFMDRLNDAIRDASIMDTYVHAVVIHISMDRVLKSLGHRGLERAAAVWSARLNAVLENEVALARLTTDDWAFVGQIGTSLESLVALCERIDDVFADVVDIEEEKLHFRPRIGIGRYPDDAADGSGVLDCAIAALSQNGAQEPRFYSRETQRRALRFIRTEARLHQAIDEDQFEVWLQPQVALEDESLVGVEALVRWRLPSGEIVPPNDFIAVANSTGLITRIDAWVLDQAAETVKEWFLEAVDIGKLSVNVSVPDLFDEGFVDRVIDTLERTGIPPPQLELEVTEDMFLECDDIVFGRLNRLREYGVGIAIDDFGTGYSSLGYLHTLPITTLKVDKQFLDKAPNDSTSDAITRSIVWLAQNFDLDIVAEGIERREQAVYARDLGIQRGQGYLFGYPTPTTAFRRQFLDGRR